MFARSCALLVSGAVLALVLITLASIATTPQSTGGQTRTPTPVPTECPARFSPPVTNPPTPYNPPWTPGSTYRDILTYSTFRFCNDDARTASKLRVHMATAYSYREVPGGPPGCGQPSVLPVNHTADEFELIVDYHTDCIDPVEMVTVEFRYAGQGFDQAIPFCYSWFNNNDELLDTGGSCPLIPSILVWGHIDCRGGTGSPASAIKTLRASASLPYEPRKECPKANAPIGVGDLEGVWGDFDCDGAFTPKDALALLLADVGLAPQPGAGCPEIGGQVAVSF